MLYLEGARMWDESYRAAPQKKTFFSVVSMAFSKDRRF